jgi:hypothetical protein
MASLATDNKAKSPGKILQYKAPKARGGTFKHEDTMELAKWVVKHERFPRRTKEADKEEYSVMWERWLKRRRNYKNALKNALILTSPDEAIQHQIDGFLSLQEYIEQETGKTMLELDKSSWWRKYLVPLQKAKEEKQKQQADQKRLTEEKKPAAKPTTEALPTLKEDTTDAVTDAMSGLGLGLRQKASLVHC